MAFAACAVLANACGDPTGPRNAPALVTFTRGPAYDTLYVADVDSAVIRQRIPLPFRTQRASVSPTGDRVALIYLRELWVMGLDGNGLMRVAAEAANVAWAPDGGRLAYVRSRLSPRLVELRVVNVDGSGDAVVGSATPDGLYGLAWSPDGRRIAFDAMNDPGTRRTVKIISTDGTGLVDVNLYMPDPDAQAIGEPTWSPDGSKLALSAYSASTGRFQLWVVTLTSRNARAVGTVTGVRPSWSPDGALLAFLDMSGSELDLFVVRPDGSGLRRITQTPDQREEVPGWVRAAGR